MHRLRSSRWRLLLQWPLQGTGCHSLEVTGQDGLKHGTGTFIWVDGSVRWPRSASDSLSFVFAEKYIGQFEANDIHGEALQAACGVVGAGDLCLGRWAEVRRKARGMQWTEVHGSVAQQPHAWQVRVPRSFFELFCRVEHMRGTFAWPDGP